MKNILFDLDGTLTNPFEGITNSIKFALERLGIPSPEDLSWCIGPPLQESFKKLIPDSSISPETAVAIYREYFSEKGLLENVPYEGIEKVLQTLRECGHRLFIATSKPHIYAKKIVKSFGLDQYFEEIYGSELDGTRSSKKDLIEHILSEQKISKKTAIMIGDRKHDLIGANQNNVRAIGVSWGYGSIEELRAEHPWVIVYSREELIEFIKSN